jgi:hypothetical protein
VYNEQDNNVYFLETTSTVCVCQGIILFGSFLIKSAVLFCNAISIVSVSGRRKGRKRRRCDLTENYHPSARAQTEIDSVSLRIRLLVERLRRQVFFAWGRERHDEDDLLCFLAQETSCLSCWFLISLFLRLLIVACLLVLGIVLWRSLPIVVSVL